MVLPGFAFLLQLQQFRLRDVPVAQPLQGAVDQPLHACPDLRTAVGDRLHALPGDHVLLLRRDQFGAVDLHQRVALPYRLPGGVDVEALDPALEPGRHRVQPPLVRLHRRHRPHGANEFPQRRAASVLTPSFCTFSMLIFTADPSEAGSSPS